METKSSFVSDILLKLSASNFLWWYKGRHDTTSVSVRQTRLTMAIRQVRASQSTRAFTLSSVLLVGGCAVPLSNLLDPIQTYEREFPAIYDDIWLHAIDAVGNNQVIRKSDYDEGLIVIEPNSDSTMSSNMADCGTQPFETTLEKSYTATISISELGEESTRVNVKVDYRINSQSQIDQRVRVFYCRSTGFWEKYVLNQIENQL